MYQSIKAMRPKRNKFNLSHEHKLSCNMGDLVPIYLEEVIPGDGFRVKSEIMMRLAPMIAPIMHRVDVWTHFFFVPNRLVWNEWEDFITGGEDGLQAPTWPHYEVSDLVTNGLMAEGTLADYFGLPTLTTAPTTSTEVSAMPFRAYTTIYNEYYRDQNLMNPIAVSRASGNVAGDAANCGLLRRRCWEKDYFTSALPWAQRGGSVSIPITPNYLDQSVITSEVALGTGTVDMEGEAGGALDPRGLQQPGSFAPLRIENLDGDAMGVDINDLRQSNALQRWLEMAARGGSRYIEQIRSFFGVTSSDARLQRPEYLGGGKQNVVISEVLQTTETGATPQGNMSGHGVSVGTTNQFSRKRFEEHGFIIGIMSVLPRTAYQQGVNRMWRRGSKFSYFWPMLAHLGEQEITNLEIYYASGAGSYGATFGYQSRYAEYKHKQSIVSGDFKSTLNYWHMGRIFNGIPALSGSFVESDPTHRIFANTDPGDHKLWCQVYNQVSALRPMPYEGTPRL